MMDKSNIKEIVIKIVFQNEDLKHDMLVQELQNTCELKELQNIKIEIENKNASDFLSRFFSGEKSKSERSKVDCFI
ncbi:Uncharacterised protein [Clostridioides difficile]|uniref:hypothetical protein n=1 Tax=Clostridioides difficile TaxID=1496 RepID=UPI001025F9FE|nr:hypothetical protein [Clostridioides difficile]VFF93587.1 Uncharacterised protein [Clostridioides difficile]VIG04531.1 Uncharacterised protein [Clostridioides difficile]HBF4772032.1 hypothetical protein [Clostridioides difficile]HBF5037961.1 hypothetical protein [Clostridioides difficile]HBF5410686.1 hypothetical protein [Clostridioides difficile]